MEFDVNNLITKDKKTIEDEKKGSGGRPPLPKSQKKDKRVMVYFTEAEIEALQKIASERGSSLSNLVRMSAIELAK